MLQSGNIACFGDMLGYLNMMEYDRFHFWTFANESLHQKIVKFRTIDCICLNARLLPTFP